MAIQKRITDDDMYQPANLMRFAQVATATSLDTSGSIVSKDTDVSVSVSAVFEIK